MAVGTFYKDRLTVDQQLAIPVLHLTEAHFLRDDLNQTAVRIGQGKVECIKIRCLGSPFVGIFDGSRCGNGTVFDGLLIGPDLLARSVNQPESD